MDRNIWIEVDVSLYQVVNSLLTEGDYSQDELFELIDHIDETVFDPEFTKRLVDHFSKALKEYEEN